MTDCLQPMGVSSNVDPDTEGLRYGQVLWAGESDGETVGVAWDWREIRSGVVAMSDPMTVLSNVRLLDDVGQALGESQRVILLNTTIYQLGWQRRLADQGPADPLPLAA